MKKSCFLMTVLLGCFSMLNAQVITVSTGAYTHEELVTEVLINSPCAIVDNITSQMGSDFINPDPFGDPYPNSIGYFENTNPNFPIQNGIILATGNVMQAPGPANTATWDNNAGNGWPGDLQLENYINAILGQNDTYSDASIIEFDFTPLTDSISFNFVFGSNEYGSWQCDYSDAFAFFLEDQVTGDIVNMALVPDTPGEVPISVTTIRDQAHNGSCNSQNPEYFDVFYGSSGQPTASAPVNLRGHTVLMQAWQYVIPNNPYRMKLVIADRGPGSSPDYFFDSAVFIEGGSFFIGDADLGDDITIENGTAVCDDEELILSVNVPDESVITWYFNGEVIPGEEGDTLLVLEPGLYGVEIFNPLAPDCNITDEIQVEFITSPILDLGEDLLVCGEIFTTLDATPDNAEDLGDITYVWFFNGVVIPDADGATLDVTEIGDYSVEVTSELGCVVTDEISVVIADFTVDLGPDATPCDETEFELFAEVIGVDPADVSFLWSTGASTQSIIVTTSGDYSVTVTYLDCIEEDSINVAFVDLPAIDLGVDIVKCAQDQVVLDATPSNASSDDISYTWFRDGGVIDDATGSTLTVTEEGLYEVVVDDNGCVSTDEITVSFYENENCIISQGISPNNDGKNDCFDLAFLNDDPGIVSLSIFNRYGRLVYKQDNYVDQWCGQADNGERLPVGNYYYLINLQNEPAKSGYIYINY